MFDQETTEKPMPIARQPFTFVQRKNFVVVGRKIIVDRQLGRRIDDQKAMFRREGFLQSAQRAEQFGRRRTIEPERTDGEEEEENDFLGLTNGRVDDRTDIRAIPCRCREKSAAVARRTWREERERRIRRNLCSLEATTRAFRRVETVVEAVRRVRRRIEEQR